MDEARGDRVLSAPPKGKGAAPLLRPGPPAGSHRLRLPAEDLWVFPAPAAP
jgi:hypothetical protein